MSKIYKPRIIDTLLKKKLSYMGAVLLQGPKWCGKTTTGEHHAKSMIFLDDPDNKNHYQLLANTQISILLEGEVPRLIDEWEITPQIWDAVRHTVDRRSLPGQFILAGSAKPVDKNNIYHSGTGRIARLLMRPMSLYESGESSGKISLNHLFSHKETGVILVKENDLREIAFSVCRGGWPFAVDLPQSLSLSVAQDYVDAIINEDVNRVDDTLRNSFTTHALMRSYARFQGTQTPLTTITEDISNSDAKISEQTVKLYIEALRNLFVIEDMEAWNPNLKSRTAIRTTPTRYFVDPSIAAASLRIGPEDLINDTKTFGFMFETLCVRDLRIYAEAIDGDVFHYRDKNCLECDCVIHLKNGQYALIEIKLGGDKLIEEAAANLKKLKSKIDTEKMGAPAFEMVLVAKGVAAYRREDGIYVVPITALKD